MGLRHKIIYHRVMEARELERKEVSPRTGINDSQNVKTSESGGIGGFDAGKKIKGRKRHIIVGTLKLMVGLMRHSTGIQDRNRTLCLLNSIIIRQRWRLYVFADAGDAGEKLRNRRQKIGTWTHEITKRSARARGELSYYPDSSSGGLSPSLAEAALPPKTSKGPSLQPSPGSPTLTRRLSRHGHR